LSKSKEDVKRSVSIIHLPSRQNTSYSAAVGLSHSI